MLEVYCYDLKKGEVDELIILLEEIKFKFIFVDKNSIKAIKEGNYREIYQARKKLEKEVREYGVRLYKFTKNNKMILSSIRVRNSKNVKL